MKSLSQYLNEGLFDAFKIMKQFTMLQADVTAKYESGEIKNEHALENYAHSVFKNYITNDKAMSFRDWWPDFWKALTAFENR